MPCKPTLDMRFNDYLRQNNITITNEDEYDIEFSRWYFQTPEMLQEYEEYERAQMEEERVREEEARQQRLFERTYAVEDGMPFPVSYYEREDVLFDDSDSDEQAPKRNYIVDSDSDSDDEQPQKRPVLVIDSDEE